MSSASPYVVGPTPTTEMTRKFLCCNVHNRTFVLLLLSLYSACAAGGGIMVGAVLVNVKKDYFGGVGPAVEMQAYMDSGSSFITLFFLPLVGSLSDTYGRKPFLWILAACTVTPFLFLVLFPDNVMVFMVVAAVANALSGSKFGSPVLMACLMDVFPGEERAFAMSKFVAITCLGLGAAPIGLASGISLQALYAIALVMSIVSTVALLLTPETLPTTNRPAFDWKNVKGPAIIKEVVKDRNLKAVAFITFCAALPEFGLMETIMFYINDRVDFTATDNGILMMEFGFIAILASSLLFSLLQRCTDEKGIVHVGLAFNLCHLVGYAVAMNKGWVFLVPVPCAAMSLITYPAAQAIVSRGRSETEQGALMGIGSSVKGLTMVIGPLLMGVLYSRCKGPPLYLPQLPMIVGALFVVAALVVSFTMLTVPKDACVANNVGVKSELEEAEAVEMSPRTVEPPPYVPGPRESLMEDSFQFTIPMNESFDNAQKQSAREKLL